MATTQPVSSATSSKGRKKTALLTRIRQQLEFYFGDANLNKDRFLQGKLQNSADGFVTLSVLLTFNKLRTLTTDENIVREAVKSSLSLVLSDDGTQVRRAMPLGESAPVDEKTLYVENLPEHADVDWVKGKFSAFGPVQYVSLPRFKSHRIKGFAFVEFDSADAVDRAVQYFTPTANPSDLYAKEAALPVIPSVTIQDFDEDDLTAKHGQKRKHDDVVMEDTPSDPPAALPEPSSAPSNSSRKLPPTHSKDAKSSHAAFSPELLPLKVMPKITWLELRVKYLAMQKASYRALKQKLKILTVTEDQADHNNSMVAELESDDDDDVMTDVSSRSSKTAQPSKAMQPDPVFVPTLEFQSGVILHLKLASPVVDKKKVIAEIRAIAHVVFVDVTSETEVFVRCDAVTAVADVAIGLAKLYPDGTVRGLDGEEEKTYWAKILTDMEQRSKARRGKAKVRGQNDIIARAEQKTDRAVKNTHIKFD